MRIFDLYGPGWTSNTAEEACALINSVLCGRDREFKQALLDDAQYREIDDDAGFEHIPVPALRTE